MDLLVFRSCRAVLGKSNYSSCDILQTDSSSQVAKDLQKLTHSYASDIILCKTLIEGVLPAALSLFMGPWSDKHGRKPIILSVLIGEFNSSYSFNIYVI